MTDETKYMPDELLALKRLHMRGGFGYMRAHSHTMFIGVAGGISNGAITGLNGQPPSVDIWAKLQQTGDIQRVGRNYAVTEKGAALARSFTMAEWRQMHEAYNAAVTGAIDDTKARLTAAVAVCAHAQHEGEVNDVWSGAMLCPLCNVNQLRWRRAAGNGHVHAKCEGTGCLVFMQ